MKFIFNIFKNKFTNDIEAIKRFLKNPTAVNKQLSKLEKILEERAGVRFDAAHAILLDYQEGKPLRHNKLLSGYLREWAETNGFSGYVKLTKFMNENEFAALLVNKSLFKDTTFRGTQHGEWTHFIQIWCIVEYHRETAFLSCTPAALYARIGKEKLKNKSPDYWLQTFEFTSEHNSNIDESNLPVQKLATSVLKFNAYLQSEFCNTQYPVLSQLIKGREAKAVSSKMLI